MRRKLPLLAWQRLETPLLRALFEKENEECAAFKLLHENEVAGESVAL